MYFWGGFGLQEGMTVIMELMVYFHDYMMVILMLILGFVSYIFVLVSNRMSLSKFLLESHFLELIWTVIPMIILLFMAFPSLYLLYLTEDFVASALVVKVVGHQWYWEYQYCNPIFEKGFDSYMKNLVPFDSDSNTFRNLDVDNRLLLPLYVSSLLLVGSADVLHSWTVPMLGVKVDAIPGRLNYLSVVPVQSGVFYGQCSELCGSNHSFMPIVVESSSPSGVLELMTSL